MLLDVRGLCKIYDNTSNPVVAVNRISWSVERGEFVAVIGPSGSGKTTLLSLVAGLILPTEGTIHLEGNDVHHLSLSERAQLRLERMGFVFQDYQLMPVLTAHENVSLPLHVRGLPLTEIRERSAWALREVGLQGLESRFPSELSGGQQQRVSIARAIAGHPALILADEPTANLDSKTAQDMIALFKRLNSELRLTFIFSTHDQRLIREVNTVYRMNDGDIQRMTA